MPSEKRQRQRQNAKARAAQTRAAAQRRRNRSRGIIGSVVILAVVGIIALLVTQSTSGGSSSKAATATTVAPAVTPTAATCPKLDGSSPKTLHFTKAPPTCIDPSKHWTATFNTSQGNVVVALDTTRTAGTVNNFIFLALYHYYDGTKIFRIDTSIDILQGGAPNTENASDPGPGYTINDEGGSFTTDSSGNLHGPFTSYSAGDLVMARTSQANSASAQFFFVAGPKANSLASGGGPYVTFGHATSGLDVLQKIEGLYVPCPSTDTSCIGGEPSTPVTINTVTISSS